MRKRPSITGGLLLCTHLYRFKTRRNKVYLVDVEHYRNDIFVIKFYLKSHQNSDKKFNLTTKSIDSKGNTVFDNDGWRILSTCLRIMLELRATYPLMSGGFIGANLEGEKKSCTKRFKVWSQAALTFFDPEHYNHYSNLDYSTYFIECKEANNPNLLEEAGRMFNELYVDQDGLFSDNSPLRVG